MKTYFTSYIENNQELNKTLSYSYFKVCTKDKKQKEICTEEKCGESISTKNRKWNKKILK